MAKLITKKTRNRILSGILAVSVFSGLINTSVYAESEERSVINESVFVTGNRDKVYTNYYNSVKDKAKPEKEIIIPFAKYDSTSPDALTGAEPVIRVDSFEGKENCLIWENDIGSVNYTFEVPESGLYNLEATYFPTSLDGASNTVEIGVKIDGEYYFNAAQNIVLDRMWKDQTAIRKDSKDNDLRPVQVFYETWITSPIKDKEGLFNEPYFFYLEEGTHTLTIEGIKVFTAFEKFVFKNYPAAPAYEKPSESDINATPPLTSQNEIKSNTIFIQAEAPTYKSASTLYATGDRTSYLTNPSHPTKQRFNTIGADKIWSKSTQAITYDFTVPNDGYYRFNLKVRQNQMRGLYSNRRVLIDGEVPCEEFNNQKFLYNTKWYTKTLQTENGEDIYVYLTAGKHNLTLEAVPGEIGEVMQRLDNLMFDLNYYYRRILMITGPNPDIYNDYYVDREIPELIPTFENMIVQLRQEKSDIDAIAGGSGSEAATLETLIVVLERCVKKKDDIPALKQQIKDSISSVSAWMRDSRDQPLELDYIEIATAHEEFSTVNKTFGKQLSFDVKAFIGSFFEDYTVLSDLTGKSINVWVSSGRDQATTIKELVDNDYNVNNQFGTSVSINLVQGAILEATLAGKGPEIGLYIGGQFPIQLAARDLLVDVSQFTDYQQIIDDRFQSSLTKLYEYEGGIYGIPITQAFPMMFYRTDILEELGINEPPETWDELIEMIPIVQRSYLGIGLLSPAATTSSEVVESGDTFAMLVLQLGKNYYIDDLSKTTFDDQEIINAFTKWTKFYTLHSFEQVYDAFTRFRTGEMPIVIQNYNTFYSQLSVSAPEIKGLWDFTSVPGTVRKDGTISHAASSGSAGAIIFKNVTDVPAAWDFIKWFTSDDVQVLYGQTIEALMGPLGRYDTANKNALKSLPWSSNEYRKIEAQMSETMEIPIIPASYATTRHIKNAFRLVVNDKWGTRFSLMRYNRDINAEITRKNEELQSFKN